MAKRKQRKGGQGIVDQYLKFLGLAGQDPDTLALDPARVADTTTPEHILFYDCHAKPGKLLDWSDNTARGRLRNGEQAQGTSPCDLWAGTSPTT